MIDIKVTGESPRKQRDLILSLQDYLQRSLSRCSVEAQTEIRRSDNDSQDLGTILSVVLAAPSAVVLANALRDWIQRNSGVSLTINGVTVENLDSGDAASVIQAITHGTS
jgi:hypothetical protein